VMSNLIKKLTAGTLAALTFTLVPSAALAHGVQGRADTPIPIEAFFAVAAAVLIVSFVGLAFGWSKPRLATYKWTRAPRFIEAIALSKVTLWVFRLITFAVFALVFSAAAFGSTLLGSNIAPLVVFVIWWIGLVPITAIFGNIWREINPWVTIADLFRFARTSTKRKLPSWVGVWPSAAIILVFAWLELVYPTPAEPRLIAFVLAAYTVLTLWGMKRYGTNAWLDSAEGFSVYTGLLALLAPVEVRNGQLGFRMPFVAATRMKIEPGVVGLIAVLIATVTYDGLSTSPFWKVRDVAASERLIDFGLNDFQAGVLIGTFGLLGSLLVFVVAFEFFSWASGKLANWNYTSVGRVASAFAHSLIPIALAYFVAHYFTLFVFQSQDIIRLASDPLGLGWNLFGTVDSRIDFQLVSAELIWAVQVIAIVVGHVVGLAYAHDRALEIGRTHKEALKSQSPMLVLMVLLTVAGLWSLSAGMSS
jgi:hypothetical protein